MTRGRVWITRTEPGATATAQAVATLGFEPLIAPVLGVHRLKPAFDPHGFDALVATSGNALDAFCALCSRRALTVWCVGDATAETARRHGFQRVISAHGDAKALAALIRAEADPSQRLFHPAARDMAWPLGRTLRQEGFRIGEAVVYETVHLRPALPEAHGLSHALLHSPRAAAPAVAALDATGILADLVFIAMSAATAAALDAALSTSRHLQNLRGRTRISAFPDEASMLKRLIDDKA